LRMAVGNGFAAWIINGPPADGCGRHPSNISAALETAETPHQAHRGRPAISLRIRVRGAPLHTPTPNLVTSRCPESDSTPRGNRRALPATASWDTIAYLTDHDQRRNLPHDRADGNALRPRVAGARRPV